MGPQDDSQEKQEETETGVKPPEGKPTKELIEDDDADATIGPAIKEHTRDP